ncbi:MAG: OmpA family protein [Erythrobacter sp.]
MVIGPKTAIIAGALIVSALAIFGARIDDTAFAKNLAGQADANLAEIDAGQVKTRFVTRDAWPTRHPVLSGGEDLDEGTRDNAAKAVGSIAGVGGVSWADGTMIAEAGAPMSANHCEDDVQELLSARSIRFEESRSDIAPASVQLLDEVAAALKPCVGSIIAITGHTDASGPEPENLTLSRDRAAAIQQALQTRGIPANGLRASGLGSSQSIEGLSSEDPANRRIEFAVVAKRQLRPAPVDTPGPR